MQSIARQKLPPTTKRYLFYFRLNMSSDVLFDAVQWSVVPYGKMLRYVASCISVCVTITQRYKRPTEDDNFLIFLLYCINTISEKRDRQYFGPNFDKFRQFFILFGTNQPDSPCDLKIVKCLISACMTLPNTTNYKLVCCYVAAIRRD